MSAKEVKFGVDARNRMLHGVELLIMKESDIMGVLTEVPASKKKAA